MNWVWDAHKNETNRRKHGLSFELARLVFDDPFALGRSDPHPDGDRWRTIGRVGAIVVFVVHTWPDHDTETGRIISARKATPYERRSYEEENF